jgi:hypothetical protein
MEVTIIFNDISFEINLSDLHITRIYKVDTNNIPTSICRGVFTKKRIIDAINESSFSIFAIQKQIVGIMCVTIYKHKTYGYMWEISYICSDENIKGVGSILIDKVKKIAKEYTYMLPITIYGLALYPASEQLYLRNKFIDNKLIINGGNKKIKGTKKGKKGK